MHFVQPDTLTDAHGKQIILDKPVFTRVRFCRSSHSHVSESLI